ncbi:hypothetical protein Gotur_033841 [Gossypium turneri]
MIPAGTEFKGLVHRVTRNGKKILEHKFGRDVGSRSSFWSWY